MSKLVFRKLRITTTVLLIPAMVFSGCMHPINANSGNSPLSARVSNSFSILCSDGNVKASIIEALPNIAYGASTKNAITSEILSHPDILVSNILAQPNGEGCLNVVDSIFNGATAESVTNQMRQIDQEMADAYKDALNSQLTELNADIKSQYGEKKISLSDIRLVSPAAPKTKGLLSANWNWDTIIWFAGIAAATTAGLVLVKYSPFWTKIAGLIVAGSGAATMGGQLAIWLLQTPEGATLRNYNSIAGMDKISELLNNPSKEMPLKLFTIGGSVGIPIGFTYIFLPELVAFLNKLYVSSWNSIMAWVPIGVTIVINGFAFSQRKIIKVE